MTKIFPKPPLLVYGLLFMFFILNVVVLAYAGLGYFNLGFVNDILSTETYTSMLKDHGFINFLIIINTVIIKLIWTWIICYPVCITASWFLFTDGSLNILGHKFQWQRISFSRK